MIGCRVRFSKIIRAPTGGVDVEVTSEIGRHVVPDLDGGSGGGGGGGGRSSSSKVEVVHCRSSYTEHAAM
jgi:hypothetical protein